MTHHVDINAITLSVGRHKSREDGMCVMEAVAWLNNEPHSDSPSCTDPIIAAFCQSLNDRMPDGQRARLKAYIPRLIGTKIAIPPTEVAMQMADVAVRRFAVAALRGAGLDGEADKLAVLPPIVDVETAWLAVYSARRAADSARFAADSARLAATSAAADSARFAADSARFAADSARFAADSARFAADSARFAADSARLAATSAAADSARHAADSARHAADSARHAATGAADTWAPALEVLDELLALC